MNSVLQSLFSNPEFQARYYHPNDPPPTAQIPAEDLETQLRKIADGLISGRYAKPDLDVVGSDQTPEAPYQKGLAPAMLKRLVGRGHSEFSTMRQQDASEFFLHLLKLITRSPHPAPLQDPVEAFRFVLEQRLQCLNCKRVRYRTDEQENISISIPTRRIPKDAQQTDISNGADSKTKEKEEFEPVSFKECLDIFTADEKVEFTCPACGSKDGFLKRSRFRTFPAILAIDTKRFEQVNWVPTKQDVPVVVDNQSVLFDAYKSNGLQPGEEELPEDTEVGAGSSNKFVPNATALASLEGMGFPRVRCEKALHATGNDDVEVASNWLFQHMDDPDIDTPMDLGGDGGGKGSTDIDPQKLEYLGDMGFSAPQARQALKETGGDVSRAVDWLFSHPDATGDFGVLPGSDKLPANFQLQSIICHKGNSMHAGHYVTFIRKEVPGEEEASWVLFNDEKVAKAADIDEMKKFAYIYFFRRL